jgi:hypothetical protein
MPGLQLLGPAKGIARSRVRSLWALAAFCSLLGCSSSLFAATLSGRFDYPWSGINNLSEEGTLDWGHWGLLGEWGYNHKYGVAPQITYSFITVTNYAGWPGPFIIPLWERVGGTAHFSWADGTPSRAIDYSDDAVSIYGDKNFLSNNLAPGFHIECPADTSPKTLRVYVGNSWGPSTFTASLTGSGGLTYTDMTLDGHKVWGNGVYTLNFQADSPGQKLIVEFTSADTFWYNSLQAATLSGTNSPPTVAITIPADGGRFSAPATFSLTAAANDSDGTVTNLTLLKGTTTAGQSISGALSATVTNLPAGAYDFVAVATDNCGLSGTSFPVRVYVTTNGGTLSGSVSTPPEYVDLTAEGTSDWAHWGLDSPTGFNHKSGVAQRIPNAGLLSASNSDLSNYSENSLTAWSWSDGTPTPASYTTNDICLSVTNDPSAAFQLTVPATNRLRRLTLYLGVLDAQGSLEARLSDFSAVPYVDRSLLQADDYGYAVYALTFASGNPGASLIVTWGSAIVLSPFYANVRLQAATLQEAPDLAAIANRTVAVGTTLTVTNTASSLNPGPLTFSLGSGAPTNASIGSNTGVLTWTPTAAQAGSNILSIVVADGAVPPLSSTQTFSVMVVATNSVQRPMLGVVPMTSAPRWALSFLAEAGVNYTVQFTNDLGKALGSATWPTLTNFVGTGAVTIITDPGAADARRFYRVLAH